MTSPAVIPSTTWQTTSKFTSSQPAPVQLDGVTEIEIRDGLAPIVASVRITAPKPDRITAPSPSGAPTWALPVTDGYVSVSCSPGTLSRDFQILRPSVVQQGKDITLTLEGIDPRGARLARAICYDAGTNGGSPFSFNPNGVGNRSASGPYIFDYSTGLRWTRGQAFEPIFAAVNLNASAYTFSASDYAALTTSSGAYSSTVTGSWDCDGMSGMEACLTALGTRGRWSFYVPASGAISLVDLSPTSGAALDLTAMPALLAWSFERDQSNTVSNVIVQGAPEVWIRSASVGSGLTADWSGADVTAYDAGDTSGPAFRRFKVDSNDSTFAPIALLNSLPMTAAAAPALAETRPFLVFLQTGGTWANWNGRVTVAVEVDKMIIDGGPAWVTAYRAASAISVTMAMMSLRLPTGSATAASVLTGLSGITLRRDVNAFKTTVKASTAYAVSAGALTSSGATATEYVGFDGSNSLNTLATELGALALRGRPRLTWTVEGVDPSNLPGTAIGIATLPSIGNVTVNGAILEKVIRQQGVFATTTWTVDFPPVSQVGQL